MHFSIGNFVGYLVNFGHIIVQIYRFVQRRWQWKLSSRAVIYPEFMRLVGMQGERRGGPADEEEEAEQREGPLPSSEN